MWPDRSCKLLHGVFTLRFTIVLCSCITLMNLSALLSSDMLLCRSWQMSLSRRSQEGWQWQQSAFLLTSKSYCVVSGSELTESPPPRACATDGKTRPWAHNDIRPPGSHSRTGSLGEADLKPPSRCGGCQASSARNLEVRLALPVVLNSLWWPCRVPNSERGDQKRRID